MRAVVFREPHFKIPLTLKEPVSISDSMYLCLIIVLFFNQIKCESTNKMIRLTSRCMYYVQFFCRSLFCHEVIQRI